MTDDVSSPPPIAPHERVFLVVVDQSEELQVALRFASLRAKRTGGQVALLYVIPPGDFMHWQAAQEQHRQEQREAAEHLLQQLSAEVNGISGRMPILFVREGDVREEVLSLIQEEPAISVLVLAAGVDPDGPGPLVSYLAGKISGQMRVPVTVVPGSLSDDELAALT